MKDTISTTSKVTTIVEFTLCQNIKKEKDEKDILIFSTFFLHSLWF